MVYLHIAPLGWFIVSFLMDCIRDGIAVWGKNTGWRVQTLRRVRQPGLSLDVWTHVAQDVSCAGTKYSEKQTMPLAPPITTFFCEVNTDNEDASYVA